VKNVFKNLFVVHIFNTQRYLR